MKVKTYFIANIIVGRVVKICAQTFKTDTIVFIGTS